MIVIPLPDWYSFPTANATSVLMLRVKKYRPPGVSVHTSLSEISIKPAASNRFFADATAWYAVQLSLMNSIMRSACVAEAMVVVKREPTRTEQIGSLAGILGASVICTTPSCEIAVRLIISFQMNPSTTVESTRFYQVNVFGS